MTGILLDTCIVIDYLRNKPEAITFVHRLAGAPLISSVTVMELYTGVRGQLEERQLVSLISNSGVVDVTGEIGALAGGYLKQYAPSDGIDVIDALIAATAKLNNLEVVTLNLKHFPMFDGLNRPY